MCYRKIRRTLFIFFNKMDAEHLLCTAPWSGTPCRTTSAHSRTTSPLDRAGKRSFSPDTSVFSALETFVIIALYKSTFTIPYRTICCGDTQWLNYSARGGGSLQARGLKGREQRWGSRPLTRCFRAFKALSLAFMAFK